MYLTVSIGCISTSETNTKPVQPEEQSIQHMILAGDSAAAKAAFQIENNPDAADEQGNTALHAAAQVNDAELVAFFLSAGASAELKNNASDTPLHVAIKNDSLKSAQILAATGNTIFARDASGKTAFELGIQKSSDYFDILITNQTAKITDSSGQTIIHYIVKNQNTAALDNALQKKLPLSAADNGGNTPLALALHAHTSVASIKMAAKLLLAGAVPERSQYAYFEDAVIARNPSLRFDDGQTPLHLAAIQGHTGITEYLLERGAVTGAQDISGATPLHEAVRYGNTDIARLLLKAGANVNARDNLGKTPILLIIPQNRQVEIYTLLISYKANINAKDMYGDTALHIATMSGADVSTLTQFTAAGADINERNKQGVTPLALAVEHQKTSLVSFYARNGADIHAEDTMGNTPLTRALKQGSDMLSKLVIAANIASRDSYGNTPLHIAVMTATPDGSAATKNYSETLQEELAYLYSLSSEVNARNRNGDTPLSIAVQRNIRSAGEYLLSRNADVFSANNEDYSPLRIALESNSDTKNWLLTSQVIKATDGSGNTPLHYAAEWGLTNAVALLTEKGAAPNAKNANGETPLFNAIKSNNPAIIAELIAKGASKDARDYLGNTPIHACVRWNAKDAAYALIRAGTNLDAQNISGKTPLSEAARSGKIDMVILLLDNGADINASDATGKTVLIDAIQSGSTELVKLLLARGASPLIQEMYGRNAFHEAAIAGNPEMITIIREAGGNPLARDTNGNTPFSLVLNKGLDTIKAVLGSNPNLIDSDSNTPIHIAVEEKAPPSVLTMLIEMKYPLNRRNSSGMTPLTMAISTDADELASILIENGADPYISDNSGECAVSAAIKLNKPVLDQIVKLAGTKTDITGEGILHYAARLADEDTVKRLLSMGLDRSKRSITGETPYDIAVRWQRPEIAALLK
ncbi:ankyrin repeat domain-containing protein [Treponema brennaborense]|nr:ankyrin repeat domain-containing protein [Treponema brennaborense]